MIDGPLVAMASTLVAMAFDSNLIAMASNFVIWLRDIKG